MAVKILINQQGHHTIAEVKQVTNKDTEETIAYWVENPRVISYSRPEGIGPMEDGNIRIMFLDPCPASIETEYGISAHHIVAILDPKPDVANHYRDLFAPTEAKEEAETTLQYEAAPAEGTDEETMEFTVEIEG